MFCVFRGSPPWVAVLCSVVQFQFQLSIFGIFAFCFPVPDANGVSHTSPGQRPGSTPPIPSLALKARFNVQRQPGPRTDALYHLLVSLRGSPEDITGTHPMPAKTASRFVCFDERLISAYKRSQSICPETPPYGWEAARSLHPGRIRRARGRQITSRHGQFFSDPKCHSK